MIPNVNSLLLNEAVKRGIVLEKYSAATVEGIVGLFNRSTEEKIATLVNQELPKAANESELYRLVRADYGQMRTSLETKLGHLSEDEQNWQLSTLKSTSPIDLNLSSLAPEELRTLVEKMPVEGALVKDWFDKLADDTAFRVNRTIQSGIVEGLGVADIVRDIKGTRAANYADGILNASRNELNTIVRTSVMTCSSDTRDAAYEANSDVISGVQLVETLDPVTCEECGALDGEVYPIDEGPRPPHHFNCRGTTVPVLKSWKELGINLKEADESTRSSMNGQVPESLSYEDWLKQQPSDLQDEILGEDKADLFRANKYKLGDFSPANLKAQEIPTRKI